MRIDVTTYGIVANWDLVLDDLSKIYRIDLWDAAVRRRPWPPIRNSINALHHNPESRLRAALIRR